MKVQAKILLAVALLISSVALAKYVGRFYCGPTGEVGAGLASGDTYTFIYTDVNQTVSSWVDPDGNPNTVLICNGTKCSLYTYVKLSGQCFAEGYFYSDWNNGNSIGGTPTGGTGGAGGSGFTIIGYTPIYVTGTVCTDGVCTTQQILVGYNPIYGRDYRDQA